MEHGYQVIPGRWIGAASSQDKELVALLEGWLNRNKQNSIRQEYVLTLMKYNGKALQLKLSTRVDMAAATENAAHDGVPVPHFQSEAAMDNGKPIKIQLAAVALHAAQIAQVIEAGLRPDSKIWAEFGDNLKNAIQNAEPIGGTFFNDTPARPGKAVKKDPKNPAWVAWNEQNELWTKKWKAATMELVRVYM